MKKILVIDGNSLLNRAFYGIRPLTTATGKHTNAVFGMVQMVKRQLDALLPDYAAVAFDVHAPTFRKEKYELYKAGRRPTPEELLSQFEDAKEVLSLMGLTVLELPGYEADDLQGTVARMARSLPDTEAYILTGDRDLLQLIDDITFVLLCGNSDTHLYDTDEFFAKYGIRPPQLIDAKALMGDSSDNIPGVRGIGEKTALKLISEFGSLDGIYENLDAPSISKGVREKLNADREMAYLSQFLATIDTAAPMKEGPEELRYRGFDEGGLYRKFSELEFFNLIQRFHLSPEGASAEGNAPTPPAESTIIYREGTAEEVLALSSPIALLLTEEGLLLASGDRYLRYRGTFSEIAPLFDGAKSLLSHDAKALYLALLREGLPLPKEPILDVMLAAYSLNPSAQNGSLPLLLTVHTGLEGESLPHLLFPLTEVLDQKLRETGCERIYREIELPLCPVLAKMEHRGFHVDTEGLARFNEELEIAAAEAADRIIEMAGIVFNLNSPKQLGEVLFERLGLPHAKKTKSGYSTDADVLNELRLHHPIVGLILEYRQLSKFRSTYGVGLSKAADEGGCIHTALKQAVTATGRLSSAEPNLQNIPVRTELGRQFRRYFIPRSEDYLLVDADYSQIELRLLAHMSGDETMIEAYKRGADIHTHTAAAAFGVPEYAVTSELRKQAKAVSFGIVYGISAYSLAADLGITVSAAKDYMDSYFAQFPHVKGYLEDVVASAKEKGYTETLLGRRRYIPELSAPQYPTRKFGERAAMNSPLQGTAADIIKIAMIKTERALEEAGIDARLILQVHDELIVEAHKDCADEAAAILKREMEGALALAVPLTVEIGINSSWYKE